MEVALSILVGCFFATSIYLVLSKHLIRILLGISILGNGTNLLIFTVGRLTRDIPPILSTDKVSADKVAMLSDIANPLPQALILTAIVISFSLFSFLLVLGYRAYQLLGTDDVKEMRMAEPVMDQLPPLSY